VDVDDEPALADQFDVTAVPTLLLLSEGKVVQTFHSVDDCKEYLKSKLS
jgi:thioredoxin-like negative regulator of GroEL